MAASDGIWFVYDGQCPICNFAAHALRIRDAAGGLTLLDARTQPGHPLMQQIKAQGLSLDEGMIVIYGGQFYHGADALHIMALLGSKAGWFNRVNAVLFRSKLLCALCYPLMRATRNLALKLKGVPQIRNLDA